MVVFVSSGSGLFVFVDGFEFLNQFLGLLVDCVILVVLEVIVEFGFGLVQILVHQVFGAAAAGLTVAQFVFGEDVELCRIVGGRGLETLEGLGMDQSLGVALFEGI